MYPENYGRGQQQNYVRLPWNKFNDNVPSKFDFDSIMLYSPAAGNNGGPTWERLDGPHRTGSISRIMVN